MSIREKASKGIGNILMYGSFLIAFVVAVVAVRLAIVDLTSEFLGVALSTMGVWIALWLFFSTEHKRQKKDEEVSNGIRVILDHLKKCECSCQADVADERECQPSS